jgi:hypothetical protein
VQQARNQHEIAEIRRRCEYSRLQKKHERKLQKSRTSTQIVREMSDSTRVRFCFDEVRVDSFHSKSQEVRRDDHDQNRIRHHTVENEHKNLERADRHSFEMRFARAKSSRKNDETVNDSHQIVDVHLRHHLSQDQNSVHFRCSLDSHLRDDSLTRSQKKENENYQQTRDHSKQMSTKHLRDI